MHDRGLNKLSEECGELIQIACKKASLEGQGLEPEIDIDKRLQEEIADVLAAIDFVCFEFALDPRAIGDRKDFKLQKFKDWHTDHSDGYL